MEAHLWRRRTNAPLPNNRFVNKALAGGFHRLYDQMRRWNLCPSGASCDCGASRGIALIGGFDGPFVALLPAAIHSTRRDDIYHRERGGIYLRRWHRPTGFRAISDQGRRAKNNVAHHYDLDGRLYSLFLDSDQQYSCAYFEGPDATLEDAQLAKKRHVAAKLLIGHGDKVLDIGSGWGGLGLYLAETIGADVTGVTLSSEQLQVSNARAAEKNLTRSAKFLLEDYRDIPGPFDRIVSVGMFEHVGVDFYDIYFQRCAELLSDDGVMLLHSIGRSDGPDVTNPFIAKYIFPGGYIPALSEVMPAIERSGLLVCDIEVLRLHYAETLKAWRERFMARRDEAIELYDERFARMWEFYLASAEMAFRKQNLMNFQIQLTKRQGVVPMTRDYITREEAKLRGLERGKRPRLQIAGG
jgi:cyclopropane-fatty-acyl-phospholipid synthase